MSPTVTAGLLGHITGTHPPDTIVHPELVMLVEVLLISPPMMKDWKILAGGARLRYLLTNPFVIIVSLK